MCLKHLGSPEEAEKLLKGAISRYSGRLRSDTYLLPYATVELALILLEAGTWEEAATLLEAAKGYKEYSLQSRLHFRIHAAQNKIRAGNNNEEQVQVSGNTVVWSRVMTDNIT